MDQKLCNLCRDRNAHRLIMDHPESCPLLRKARCTSTWRNLSHVYGALFPLGTAWNPFPVTASSGLSVPSDQCKSLLQYLGDHDAYLPVC